MGPISHLSIQGFVIYSSQLVTGASYAGGMHAGGMHRFWLSFLLGEHVETTMCLHGEIRKCTWQWGLLFPSLYHILKFASVSLGTDFSIMSQSSAISLVCDGSIR